MPNSKKWIITTSANRPLQELKNQLTEKGFRVDQVLESISCLTGFAGEDVAYQVRKIPGVIDVSADTNIDIGPPDAPVTW